MAVYSLVANIVKRLLLVGAASDLGAIIGIIRIKYVSYK
jgi:multisubunit Na+/H+ antiporter MnhG subunit